jgi:hypothetical protein
MSPLTHAKQPPPANGLPLRATIKADADSIALLDDRKKTEFSLASFLHVVNTDDKAGLLSRIDYHFSRRAAVTISEALDCAEALNQLLVHSKVFVVQDIDGDHRYFLRMDTLLPDSSCRENIANFLDDIVADVGLLLRYCRPEADDFN